MINAPEIIGVNAKTIDADKGIYESVSYTHLDVYKRQLLMLHRVQLLI